MTTKMNKPSDASSIDRETDKNRHTREAYRLGYAKGQVGRSHMEPPEYYDHAIGYGWIESDRDVAMAMAENARDSGSASGLAVLNRLESIADSGVTLSRFCENGDSCMHPVYGGMSSGIVDERQYLIDETIQAFDDGYVDACMEDRSTADTISNH